MTAISVGQRFESLAEFKAALRKWAIDSNFTPAILDSDSRRVRAGCRTSPNCPFRIRCNFNTKTGVANVTTLDSTHTCTPRNRPGGPNIKRAETCKLKFLLEAVPQLLTVDRDTSTKAIIDVVKARYGQEIAMRQAQKVKATLLPKATETNIQCACGSTDHTTENCPNNARTDFTQPDSSMTEDHHMDIQVIDDIQAPSRVLQPPVVTGLRRTSSQNYQQPPASDTASFQSTRAPSDADHLNNHDSYNFVRQSSQSQQAQSHATTIPAPLPPQSQPQPPPLPPPAPPPLQHQQSLPPALGTTTSNLDHQPLNASSPRQNISTTSSKLPHSAADVRLEASRLMSRAAQLMMEAARLNAEAARLNASVASA